MRWGELREGDVILHGPLEDWRHAWVVTSTGPDIDHEGCVRLEVVDLDTFEKTRHTRTAENAMADHLGYDVLRGQELVKGPG